MYPKLKVYPMYPNLGYKTRHCPGSSRSAAPGVRCLGSSLSWTPPWIPMPWTPCPGPNALDPHAQDHPCQSWGYQSRVTRVVLVTVDAAGGVGLGLHITRVYILQNFFFVVENLLILKERKKCHVLSHFWHLVTVIDDHTPSIYI